MATTDSRLALTSLEGMRTAGVRFALLHGADRLSAGDVSDVDLVVGEDPAAVVRRAAAPWEARGLIPVLLWPYDIGGTATVFLAIPDASEGVQLDLLYDPGGVGKYGVRSRTLLASATQAAALPQVSDVASLVYQWQKRTAKRDVARLDDLTGLAGSIDPRVLLATSKVVTGSSEAAWHMLEGKPGSRARRPHHPLLQASRLRHRLANPVGFWAHTPRAEIATEMTQRFSRFLVCAASQPTPSPARQPAWWVTTVMPTRLRPGVFVSHGPLPRWRAPDAVLTASSADEAARQFTSAMNARLTPERSRPGDANLHGLGGLPG
jgi:hypothetical protein